MHRLIRLGLLLQAVMMATMLFAAESERTLELDSTITDQATAASEEPDTVQPLPDIGLVEEERVAEEDDENFVPSIRITEDLPVAFPVDI